VTCHRRVWKPLTKLLSLLSLMISFLYI
jgi:hypothetical protein